jgi:membrane-associated phospholipid phosphatase
VSVAEDTGRSAGEASWLRRIARNMRATIATLLRAPRCHVAYPSRGQLAVYTAIPVASVLGTMAVFDAWSVRHVAYLPISAVGALDHFTDFGLSRFFLLPVGIVMIALAVVDSLSSAAFSRHVLAAWTVRLGFVFTAIALPALFASIVKRLIGRARPLVDGDGVWNYLPLVWRTDHASLPSGHATTAFAALVAIGALFPSARPLMWIYAILIALSRVAITAHFPSDVLAGAIVGATGAYLVRVWFARRRLGFVVGADGAVRPLPGPSMRRIIKAVARSLHAV